MKKAKKQDRLVSVLIPSLNTLGFLRDCIKALKKSTKVPIEILVLDLGDDGTYEWCFKNKIKVFKHTTPFYFAQSNNYLAERAKGDILLFLNSDTVPQKGFLEAMLEQIDNHGADITGCLMIYPNNIVQHAGIQWKGFYPSWNDLPDHVGYEKPIDTPELHKDYDVKAITGSCLLIKKHVFEALGHFDESFRNCYDDIDLCIKAHISGYKVRYTGKGKVVHYVSGTRGTDGNSMTSGQFMSESVKRLLAKYPSQPKMTEENVPESPNIQDGGYSSTIVKNNTSWQHRLLIGTPTTGQVRMEWVFGRYGQVIPTNWSNVDMTEWMSGYAPLEYLVPDAQNLIVRKALTDGFQFVLFFEQDNIPLPDAFIRLNEYMLADDPPIVSGLYFTKSVPPEPIIYRGRGNGYYTDWKIGDKVWVDGVPTGFCTPAGTLIKGKSSWSPIEDVEEGGTVLSHTGEERKVIKTMERSYSGQMIDIKPRMFCETIRLTPEHPVLAMKGRFDTNGMLRKPMSAFRKTNYEAPSWIDAKDITDEHILLYKIDTRIKDLDKININDFVDNLTIDNKFVWFPNKNGYQENRINKSIKVDNNLLRLIGYYLAEGDISKGHLRFSFHKNETEYIEDVAKIIKNTFGMSNYGLEKSHGSYENSNDNGVRMCYSSKVLAEWFKSNFSEGAYNKYIPEWIMKLPSKKQAHLLLGYMRGDGNYFIKDRCYRIFSNTVSRQLSLGLREILLRMGIIPTYRKTLNDSNNERYEIGFYGDDAIQFLKGYEDIKIIDKRVKRQGNSSWIKDGYAWLPVRSVNTSYFEGSVYNFSVEGDESYITSSFIVHNCLINSKILAAMWDESPEYMVGGIMTRRVFEQPRKLDFNPEKGELTVSTGTSDLEFCTRLKRDNIFTKAGFPKYQEMEFPILCDTNIFCWHIDPQGRRYPIGGVPSKFKPLEKNEKKI